MTDLYNPQNLTLAQYDATCTALEQLVEDLAWNNPDQHRKFAGTLWNLLGYALRGPGIPVRLGTEVKYNYLNQQDVYGQYAEQFEADTAAWEAFRDETQTSDS